MKEQRRNTNVLALLL
jgi:hypothetical protein